MRFLILLISVVLVASPAKGQVEDYVVFQSTSQRQQDNKAAQPDSSHSVDDPCSSPRSAMVTFLSWLQEGSYSPGRASACFDTSMLNDTTESASKLAIKLKRIMDSRGLLLPIDRIPDDPYYTDTAGNSRYEPFTSMVLPIYLEKKDGRWLFPSDVLNNITTLYSATFPFDLSANVDKLPSWLKTPVVGVKLWQLFFVFALILFALITQRVILWLSQLQVRRALNTEKENHWINKSLDTVGAPLGTLAMAAVFWLGFPLIGFTAGVNRVVLFATKVLFMISVVWFGYRMADILSDILAKKTEATETKLDDQLVPLVRKTMKVMMFVIGGLFILQNLHVDIGSLLAGLGLGGLAFALAAKDTVANFFGSLMIFVDRPFQIGDWIRIGSTEGTVEEVGFRSTRIRTFYNSLITFPNANLMDSAVDNLGAREYRRYSTTLRITMDTSPERVEQFCQAIRQAILDLEGMRTDYFMVELENFGTHSLDIKLYCFMVAPDWVTEMKIRTALNLQILRIAKDLGVAFAFPTHTVRLPEGAPHKLSNDVIEELIPKEP